MTESLKYGTGGHLMYNSAGHLVYKCASGKVLITLVPCGIECGSGYAENLILEVTEMTLSEVIAAISGNNIIRYENRCYEITSAYNGTDEPDGTITTLGTMYEDYCDCLNSNSGCRSMGLCDDSSECCIQEDTDIIVDAWDPGLSFHAVFHYTCADGIVFVSGQATDPYENTYTMTGGAISSLTCNSAEGSFRFDTEGVTFCFMINNVGANVGNCPIYLPPGTYTSSTACGDMEGSSTSSISAVTANVRVQFTSC